MLDNIDNVAIAEGLAIVAIRQYTKDRPRIQKGVKVNYFSNTPKIVKRASKMAGRNKVNPNETPADRFKRLGNVRLSKAVKAVGLIGHLTGSQYVRTPEQVNIIEKTLQDSVNDAVVCLRLGRGNPQVKSWL